MPARNNASLLWILPLGLSVAGSALGSLFGMAFSAAAAGGLLGLLMYAPKSRGWVAIAGSALGGAIPILSLGLIGGLMPPTGAEHALEKGTKMAALARADRAALNAQIDLLKADWIAGALTSRPDPGPAQPAVPSWAAHDPGPAARARLHLAAFALSGSVPEGVENPYNLALVLQEGAGSTFSVVSPSARAYDASRSLPGEAKRARLGALSCMMSQGDTRVLRAQIVPVGFGQDPSANDQNTLLKDICLDVSRIRRGGD